MRRAHVADTGHRSQLRDSGISAWTKRRPAHTLLEAIDVAPYPESDRVHGCIGEAELRHRDRELGCPPERVDRRGDVPDSVPCLVLVRIVIHRVIALHSTRAHPNSNPAASVVIRIDHHLELIRWRTNVPARKGFAYPRRLGIEG